jgi:hypothetical protein
MKTKIYLLAILIVVRIFPAAGQNEVDDSLNAASDTITNDFGLFSNEEILNLSLRFDVQEYMRKKPKEDYLKAVLTYHINEKDSLNKDIKLRSRGISRNNICSFPPLSLNFKKAGFKKSDLKDIGKIKMVTHCKSGNEDYLFKEYLIYKLYNVLTDYSFKVRLVKVDYISTGKKTKTINSYAFLIEPMSMLTERTHSNPVDLLNLSNKNIIPEIMDRMTIFNYMIGNTDWSVAGQHNCKIILTVDPAHPGLGITVPYDFDYAGLVNAYYALPTEGLDLKSVRERRYMGNCRSIDEINTNLKQFSDNKSEFYRIVNEFSYLNDKSKKEMINYLDEFYSVLENGSLVKTFQRECKQE